MLMSYHGGMAEMYTIACIYIAGSGALLGISHSELYGVMVMGCKDYGKFQEVRERESVSTLALYPVSFSDGTDGSSRWSKELSNHMGGIDDDPSKGL